MVAPAIGVDRTIEGHIWGAVAGDDRAWVFDRDGRAQRRRRTVDQIARVESVTIVLRLRQVESGAGRIVGGAMHGASLAGRHGANVEAWCEQIKNDGRVCKDDPNWVRRAIGEICADGLGHS